MRLAEGLEVLVEDWRDLHEDGGTKLTVAQLVARLNPGIGNTLIPGMEPREIAEMIINDLRTVPGVLENAARFMAQFESPGDLLEEMDLDCLVSDLAMREEENV